MLFHRAAQSLSDNDNSSIETNSRNARQTDYDEFLGTNGIQLEKTDLDRSSQEDLQSSGTKAAASTLKASPSNWSIKNWKKASDCASGELENETEPISLDKKIRRDSMLKKDGEPANETEKIAPDETLGRDSELKKAAIILLILSSAYLADGWPQGNSPIVRPFGVDPRRSEQLSSVCQNVFHSMFHKVENGLHIEDVMRIVSNPQFVGANLPSVLTIENLSRALSLLSKTAEFSSREIFASDDNTSNRLLNRYISKVLGTMSVVLLDMVPDHTIYPVMSGIHIFLFLSAMKDLVLYMKDTADQSRDDHNARKIEALAQVYPMISEIKGIEVGDAYFYFPMNEHNQEEALTIVSQITEFREMLSPSKATSNDLLRSTSTCFGKMALIILDMKPCHTVHAEDFVVHITEFLEEALLVQKMTWM